MGNLVDFVNRMYAIGDIEVIAFRVVGSIGVISRLLFVDLLKTGPSIN